MTEIHINSAMIMTQVEGISVIISEKNGEGTSFEQLWASEGDRKKLDIYYREAISDLEKHLLSVLQSSSSQFDLSPLNETSDYVLKIRVNYWPDKLRGLFANKVQDYLVHSIVAGWLNSFSGLDIKADYATMAGQDLRDIDDILSRRDYRFQEDMRNVSIPTGVRRRTDEMDWSGSPRPFVPNPYPPRPHIIPEMPPENPNFPDNEPTE